MKKIVLLLILCLAHFSNAQQSKDANGKILSEAASSEIKSPEKIIQLFYNNLTDFKTIYPLISAKFFQKKTVAEFHDQLTENHKLLGKVKERKLVKMQKTDSGNTITYLYAVKYENDHKMEEIRLSRPNEKESYKIVAYAIVK